MSATTGDTDRSLSRGTVERAVAAMKPDWQVHNATLADEGHLAVYHLELDATAASDRDDAPDTAVLKATPPSAA